MSDIINGENIYGPWMEIFNGNSTRIKTRLVITDDIQIPSEIYKNNSNIELFVGVFYINGVSFLVSTDRQVKYKSFIHIIYHNEEFFKNLDKTLQKYNSAGFTIIIING